MNDDDNNEQAGKFEDTSFDIVVTDYVSSVKNFIDKKLTYWRKHNESYDTTASGDFDNKCQKLREFSNKLLKKN